MDKTFNVLFLVSLLLAFTPRVFGKFIPPQHARWFLPAALALLGIGIVAALVKSAFWFAAPSP